MKELQVQETETETDRKRLERKLIALKAKGQIGMQRSQPDDLCKYFRVQLTVKTINF